MNEKSNISIDSNIYPVTSEEALRYRNETLRKVIKLLVSDDIPNHDKSCKKELLPCYYADGKSPHGIIGNNETERIVCRCRKISCKRRKDCQTCPDHE